MTVLDVDRNVSMFAALAGHRVDFAIEELISFLGLPFDRQILGKVKYGLAFGAPISISLTTSEIVR